MYELKRRFKQQTQKSFLNYEDFVLTVLERPCDKKFKATMF